MFILEDPSKDLLSICLKFVTKLGPMTKRQQGRLIEIRKPGIDSRAFYIINISSVSTFQLSIHQAVSLSILSVAATSLRLIHSFFHLYIQSPIVCSFKQNVLKLYYTLNPGNAGIDNLVTRWQSSNFPQEKTMHTLLKSLLWYII